VNSRIVRSLVTALLALAVSLNASLIPKKKAKVIEPSALDKYIQEATAHEAPVSVGPSAGSLWSPNSRITDLGSDIRAVQVNDLVTIVVAEQASAVVNGATQTSRKSSVAASVTQLAGVKSPTGALANLAGASGDTELNGTGTTSRGSSLSTTLSARVTHVLPNGYLVLEGSKEVNVNSEHQHVTIRGIIRTTDLSSGNIVTSNQLAQMEINVDGKGVVNDATHRPINLYRIILGLLPF
jgi:flagellar L-ring protein precursor FlgH